VVEQRYLAATEVLNTGVPGAIRALSRWARMGMTIKENDRQPDAYQALFGLGSRHQVDSGTSTNVCGKRERGESHESISDTPRLRAASVLADGCSLFLARNHPRASGSRDL
jgi:hypothetical protein